MVRKLAPKKQEYMEKEIPIPSVTPKSIKIDQLRNIEPLTPGQEELFKKYTSGKNIVAHGFPGTGKTFLVMYLAFREILLRESNYDKVVVVRSAIPVIDQGHLPGDISEKELIFQMPYHAIFKELFNFPASKIVSQLIHQGLYEFISTSYIRGVTINNAIVIVDEFENLDGHSLDSIITRCGSDCKIIFCGDKAQSDLKTNSDRNGMPKFLNILNSLDEFGHVEFGVDDIVRSSLVKNYIIKKSELSIEF